MVMNTAKTVGQKVGGGAQSIGKPSGPKSWGSGPLAQQDFTAMCWSRTLHLCADHDLYVKGEFNLEKYMA